MDEQPSSKALQGSQNKLIRLNVKICSSDLYLTMCPGFLLKQVPGYHNKEKGIQRYAWSSSYSCLFCCFCRLLDFCICSYSSWGEVVFLNLTCIMLHLFCCNSVQNELINQKKDVNIKTCCLYPDHCQETWLTFLSSLVWKHAQLVSTQMSMFLIHKLYLGSPPRRIKIHPQVHHIWILTLRSTIVIHNAHRPADLGELLNPLGWRA